MSPEKKRPALSRTAAQRILFVFLVIINMASYSLVSWDRTHCYGDPLEERQPVLLTISAFGGSFGVLTGLYISENTELLTNRPFVTALKLIFLQNMLAILVFFLLWRER